MESHLLQMRGLKQPVLEFFRNYFLVASFTDAWIETGTGGGAIMNAGVASFTDAWIETVSWWHCEKTPASHLLQMRGLKQDIKLFQTRNNKSHLLQMRGLKQ